MHIKTFSIIFLFLISHSARAEKWIHFSTTEEEALLAKEVKFKTKAFHYFDTESLKRRGSKILVWQMDDYESRRGSAPMVYNKSISLKEIDCIDSTTTEIASTAYLDNKVVLTDEIPLKERTTRNIRPSTLSDDLRKKACGSQ